MSTLGKDFNYYLKIGVSSATFQTTADISVPFSTQGFLFWTESSSSTGVVEYSFNGGVTVHGELDGSLMSAPRFILFPNRILSKAWFRVKAGSTGPITVRIDAWSHS